MRHRDPEYCPRCGNPLNAIHKNMGKGFVGDTFVRYEPCNCKSQPKEKVQQLFDEKDVEIERLKNLLKIVYKQKEMPIFVGLNTNYDTVEALLNKKWEQFKSENNL